MSLAIFTDLVKAQAYSDQIHEWLKKNRKEYTAECWSKVDEGGADKVTEWYVKVPPDYEVLNAKIPLPKDKLTISADAVRVVEKLPDDWKTAVDIEEPKPKSFLAQAWDGIKGAWNSFFG